jgi:SAM-dependent methyltransferase
VSVLRLRLPPRGTLRPNNDVDPLRFYYRPLVGRVFRARIDAGLALLDGLRFDRLLEIGYGSGLLMPTLAPLARELHGADLEAEPPNLRATLARLGAHPASLVQADIRRLPFPDAHFDGAIAFSILEHLRAGELLEAGRELARVVSPGGRLLVGCPAVHRAMNAAFSLIGFAGIEQHHFSSIADAVTALAPAFTVEKHATWPRLLSRAPLGLAPYTCVLLRREAC